MSKYLLIISLLLCVLYTCRRDKDSGYRNYQEVTRSVTSQTSTDSHPAPVEYVKPMTDNLPTSLAYIKPNEWKEVSPTNNMIKTSFVSKSGSQITLSAFPGDVGGLAANLDRWARQIGLNQSQTTKQLLKHIAIKKGRREYIYVSYLPFTSKDKLSVLAGIYRFRDKTLFVKMTGIHRHLALEEQVFIVFLNSMQ